MGFVLAAGAEQLQVLSLLQPVVAAGQHLQLLPLLGLEILAIKTIDALL